MVTEKMRVHILAKELSVPSKVIIEKCKAEGITVVKNHMSTLSAGLHATIREWFSEGGHNVALETSARVDLDKVRIKRKTKRKPAKKSSGWRIFRATILRFRAATLHISNWSTADLFVSIRNILE